MANLYINDSNFNKSEQNVDNLRAANIQKFVNSGILDYSPILKAGLNSNMGGVPTGQIALSVNGSPAGNIANRIDFGPMTAVINGNRVPILGSVPANSDVYFFGSLSAPPSSSGSTRDDLVFLETWFPSTWKPGQFMSYAVRSFAGIDFATYSEGINQTSIVKAQGGAASVTAYTYSKFSTIDSGLYVAGDGSATAQSGLSTFDGYVYAIPLVRIRRRNNAGFNLDTNPYGSIDYLSVTENASTTYDGTISVPSTFTITMSSALPSTFQIGKNVFMTTNATFVGNISNINGNQVTLNNAQSLGNLNLKSQTFYIGSDRPDNMFSNVVDPADIVDLRHQVAFTGFNYQALLESNLDLLMRGQLATNVNKRYARDYIGLNITNYPDDTNTLLYCKYDGSSSGTANAVIVPNTLLGTGTEAFGNGLNGLSLNLTGGTDYCEQYPITLNATGTVELAFKMSTTSGNKYMFSAYGSSAQTLRKFGIFINSSGIPGFSYYNDSGTLVATISSTTMTLVYGDPTWHLLRFTFDTSGMTLYIDGIQVLSTATAPTWTTITHVIVGSMSDGASTYNAYPFKGYIDLVRVSNIVRLTDAILPTNFNPKNGDRLLDGPYSDFSQWSDDLGGIAGVNGRTNPYGLSCMPNLIPAKVKFNGTEIRHYYKNGFTPTWAGTPAGSTPSTGYMEMIATYAVNSEYVKIPSIEITDGTRTTFTFNIPTTFSGIFITPGNYTINQLISVDYVNATLNSITHNTTTGLVTAVLPTAPASGSIVRVCVVVGDRHFHLSPSTKGFVIHDWVDDTFTANGSTTVFQTTKFNGNVNCVKTALAASTNIQTVQPAATYSLAGTNAASILTASAVSGATSITIADSTFFLGTQNIRISDGSGGWYTTTVTSKSGNTLTIPATTISLSSGATIQGASIVTFSSAPAAGNVDIIYERTITPSINDSIIVCYQSTPYQGTLAIFDSYTILAESNAIVTSLGTGTVYTGSYSGTAGMTSFTTNLPTQVQDYVLKNDSFIGTTRSSVTTKQMIQSTWDDVPYGSSYIYHSKRIGNLVGIGSSITPTIRGFQSSSSTTLTSAPATLYTEQISTAVPTKTIFAQLMKDQNGELRLLVWVKQQSSNQPQLGYASDNTTSFDSFRIQGRPLVKGYGGVTN